MKLIIRRFVAFFITIVFMFLMCIVTLITPIVWIITGKWIVNKIGDYGIIKIMDFLEN